MSLRRRNSTHPLSSGTSRRPDSRERLIDGCVSAPFRRPALRTAYLPYYGLRFSPHIVCRWLMVCCVGAEQRSHTHARTHTHTYRAREESTPIYYHLQPRAAFFAGRCKKKVAVPDRVIRTMFHGICLGDHESWVHLRHSAQREIGYHVVGIARLGNLTRSPRPPARHLKFN